MRIIPSRPPLQLSDKILNVLSDAEDVINNKFVKVEEFDNKDLQDMKDKYNFDDIKSEFDNGKIPDILEFLYGGDDNENFRINCKMLDLTNENNDFIDIL